MGCVRHSPDQQTCQVTPPVILCAVCAVRLCLTPARALTLAVTHALTLALTLTLPAALPSLQRPSLFYCYKQIRFFTPSDAHYTHSKTAVLALTPTSRKEVGVVVWDVYGTHLTSRPVR